MEVATLDDQCQTTNLEKSPAVTATSQRSNYVLMLTIRGDDVDLSEGGSNKRLAWR